MKTYCQNCGCEFEDANLNSLPVLVASGVYSEEELKNIVAPSSYCDDCELEAARLQEILRDIVHCVSKQNEIAMRRFAKRKNQTNLMKAREEVSQQ